MPQLEVGVPGKTWITSASGATAASAGYTPTAAAAASAGGAGRKLIVTHFSGSSDLATLYTIESPSGTVIWRKRASAVNSSLSENFDPGLRIDTTGQAVVFRSSAGTAATEVNGAGYEVVSA